MKNFMRVALVLALAAWARSWWTSSHLSPISYTDTRGVSRRLGSGKPAVVVLWVTPCAYCARDLNVLDEVRRLYPEEDLDVVGFYLNRAADSEIDAIASREGHSVTMAQGQPSGEFVQTLTKSLNFRGTGRDIYVVRGDGRYDAVDARDLSAPLPALRDKVRSLLLNDLRLKERG
jgi:hypothetical protein